MFPLHHDALLDFLRSEGLAGQAELRELDAHHRATGKSVAELAIARDLVGRTELLERLAAQAGWTLAGDDIPAPSADAVALLPAALGRRYGVVPLRIRPRGIDVLTGNPFDAQVGNDLAFALGRDVCLMLGDPERVEALVREHYGGEDGRVEEAAGMLAAGVAGPAGEGDLEALAAQPPVVRFVNVVLRQAVIDRASDVHFEPFEDAFRIRYRVDGALRELPSPPRHLALPVTSRLKVLADLNIAERRLPQDGRISFRVEGRRVDLRLSTLPTQFGESAVLRVLDQSNVQLEMNHLGLPRDALSGLRAIMRHPHGIVIATGPTGSGKTTTLYSALRLLNEPRRKILTVEDPVEYEVEGMMQVAVNPAAGLTFASALRSFLRQDPDVIMVGEIRDSETARLAVQAALTGHLVLSTLHTMDAAGAVVRLVDLGVEPFLVAATLEGVLAQRLVRRVCPRCRAEAEPPERLLRRIGVTPGTLAGRTCWAGRGCEHCGGSGYQGRIGVFEWMRVSEPMREDIGRGVPALRIRERAIEEGMRPLRDEALQAVFTGRTTLEEAVQCCAYGSTAVPLEAPGSTPAGARTASRSG